MTLAPATAPPCGSCTVPLKLALVCAKAETASNSANDKSIGVFLRSVLIRINFSLRLIARLERLRMGLSLHAARAGHDRVGAWRARGAESNLRSFLRSICLFGPQITRLGPDQPLRNKLNYF